MLQDCWHLEITHLMNPGLENKKEKKFAAGGGNGDWYMRNLIDILDLSTDELEELIKIAEDIIANPKAYSEKCHGKKMATLFYEPSTRTRLSFEAAMYELGGNVLGFSSGIPNPSDEDFEMTKKVGQAADIMGITLLDHIVIGTRNCYYSMRQNGILGNGSEQEKK